MRMCQCFLVSSSHSCSAYWGAPGWTESWAKKNELFFSFLLAEKGRWKYCTPSLSSLLFPLPLVPPHLICSAMPFRLNKSWERAGGGGECLQSALPSPFKWTKGLSLSCLTTSLPSLSSPFFLYLHVRLS